MHSKRCRCLYLVVEHAFKTQNLSFNVNLRYHLAKYSMKKTILPASLHFYGLRCMRNMKSTKFEFCSICKKGKNRFSGLLSWWLSDFRRCWYMGCVRPICTMERSRRYGSKEINFSTCKSFFESLTSEEKICGSKNVFS